MAAPKKGDLLSYSYFSTLSTNFNNYIASHCPSHCGGQRTHNSSQTTNTCPSNCGYYGNKSQYGNCSNTCSNNGYNSSDHYSNNTGYDGYTSGNTQYSTYYYSRNYPNE